MMFLKSDDPEIMKINCCYTLGRVLKFWDNVIELGHKFISLGFYDKPNILFSFHSVCFLQVYNLFKTSSLFY